MIIYNCSKGAEKKEKRKILKNQKGLIMKKETLQYLLDMMNTNIIWNGGEKNTHPDYVAVRNEIQAELDSKAKAENTECEVAKAAIQEIIRVANIPAVITKCDGLTVKLVPLL